MPVYIVSFKKKLSKQIPDTVAQENSVITYILFFGKNAIKIMGLLHWARGEALILEK